MRNKNEIMRIVADNTDFQNYYNELKDYFEKYKPYSRFFYDENIQIGLDNISQMLIEKCKIYKYKEWYCAMYESLEYLIGEDRLTQKDIEERIDMIWRGREHNFDTLNNKNICFQSSLIIWCQAKNQNLAKAGIMINGLNICLITLMLIPLTY